jgi:hypothetical protein
MIQHYEVYLKDNPIPLPIDADKMCCDELGYVVFYSRPAPGEKFGEVARIKSPNMKGIKET